MSSIQKLAQELVEKEIEPKVDDEAIYKACQLLGQITSAFKEFELLVKSVKSPEMDKARRVLKQQGVTIKSIGHNLFGLEELYTELVKGKSLLWNPPKESK